MGDGLYHFQGDDERMNQAALAAQETFRFLWRELSWESRRIVPGLDMSVVKHPFPAGEPEDGNAEHMWVGEIGFDGVAISGALMNQPNYIPDLNEGDPVSFPLNGVTDWMYAIDGKVFGGFSIQVMRAGMSPAERRQHDEAWGLQFPDPATVRLTPSMSYQTFRSTSAELIPEHEMSLNMKKKSEEGVRSLGKRINDLIIGDMTLLHYDALAGNLTQVESLLALGADKHTKDGHGKTALDYARLMGWKKIEKRLA